MRTRSVHGSAHHHPRIDHLVDSVVFWSRLSLLQLFGPATQDSDHDPISRLKREYGRPLPPWDEGTRDRAAERARAIEAIRESPPDALPDLWRRTQARWGDEASRLWQEAFSADDASPT